MMSSLPALLSVLFLAANTASGSDFHVTITDGQRIVTERSVIHKVGEDLLLNCSVSPTIKSSLVITWYKNDSPFSSANTSQQWLLNGLYNITLLDGGYYKCQAKYQNIVNNAGIFVNVEGKPQIIDCCGRMLLTGNPVYVQALDTVTLKCYGTGWPIPTFRWLHNGNEMKADVGEKLGTFNLKYVQNGLELTFHGIMKHDEGQYICEAKNSYGADTRANDVTVFGRRISGEPTIKATKSHIHADVGQPNVTFSCIAENVCKSNADTAWLYNGKELPQGVSSRVFKVHYYDQNKTGVVPKVYVSLTLMNVSKDDHGNYTCKVAALGKIVNSTILLTVGKSESNKPKKDRKTLNTQEIIALVVGIVVLIAVIIILSVIVLKKRRKKAELEKIPKGSFKYDAFITYCSQDYAWVQAYLLPLLQENGIEACIYYRNFDAGVLFEQNMVNCVYNSRFVIVIMSKGYMRSKYCRSELDYAIHRSVEEPKSNSLITLRIDKDIKESKLPKAIRNKTFLDVVSDVEKDTWRKRLISQVKGNVDQNINILNYENNVDNKNIDVEEETLLDHSQHDIA